MRRYMNADLSRIYSRKPRIIILLIFFILCAVNCIFSASAATSMASLASDCLNTVGLVCTIFGVIEIVYVYGDDFKAKTIQVAIGTGIKRQKIVHAKLLEYMICVFTDIVIATVITVVCAIITKGMTGNLYVSDVIVFVFIEWFKVVAALATSMFLMYIGEGIIATLLAYLLLAGGVITSVIQLLAPLAGLSELHLHTYTLSSQVSTLQARLELGYLNWVSLLIILLHMMFGFALASILFKNKELEF